MTPNTRRAGFVLDQKTGKYVSSNAGTGTPSRIIRTEMGQLGESYSISKSRTLYQSERLSATANKHGDYVLDPETKTYKRMQTNIQSNHRARSIES
jgi:hypothetical protein